MRYPTECQLQANAHIQNDHFDHKNSYSGLQLSVSKQKHPFRVPCCFLWRCCVALNASMTLVLLEGNWPCPFFAFFVGKQLGGMLRTRLKEQLRDLKMLPYVTPSCCKLSRVTPTTLPFIGSGLFLANCGGHLQQYALWILVLYTAKIVDIYSFVSILRLVILEKASAVLLFTCPLNQCTLRQPKAHFLEAFRSIWFRKWIAKWKPSYKYPENLS